VTPLLALRGRQVIRALGRAGFATQRIRGNHHLLRHPDGRRTVVPVHAGETIGPGLLARILRYCEMEAEDLKRLR
jgi:predicted RNA binding protein YcfA (HicA-like mRNA interferase family)